jgi:hypothetical protein
MACRSTLSAVVMLAVHCSGVTMAVLLAAAVCSLLRGQLLMLKSSLRLGTRECMGILALMKGLLYEFRYDTLHRQYLTHMSRLPHV